MRKKIEKMASTILAGNGAKSLPEEDEATLYAYAERHKRSLAFVVREALTHYATLLREKSLEPPTLPGAGALDRDASIGGKTHARIPHRNQSGGSS